MKQLYIIRDEAVFNLMCRYVRDNMRSGEVLKVQISTQKDTRTLQQNAKFHAICEELSKLKIKWAGKPRTATQWKVLLVSAHSVATKEPSEIVPGLEGEFVNLRESTANMDVARGSSLIEYSTAFLACKKDEA